MTGACIATEQPIFVTKCSVQEETALYHAAQKRDTNVVQLLLSKGANVNAKCGRYVSGACSCAHRTQSLQTYQK